MNIIKNVNSMYRKLKLENEICKAELERSGALAEYIAMMADVELPDYEEEEADMDGAFAAEEE